jgi:divalent metal cation (Fe/Co/Zn/Cd) transporter
MGMNNRVVAVFIFLMFVFGAIFFLAFTSLQKKTNLFGIRGLPAEFEDWMIMILCIGSIAKIVWEIYKIKQ